MERVHDLVRCPQNLAAGRVEYFNGHFGAEEPDDEDAVRRLVQHRRVVLAQGPQLRLVARRFQQDDHGKACAERS